jgi:transcriptional regulator with XRE-family HTH domain
VAEHGELARQHRLYTSLTVRDFSQKLGISESSLIDIEKGRRDLPEDVMDRIEQITEEFDEAVDAAVAAAEKMITSDEESVQIPVSTDEPWQRAVLGRAAVLSGTIVPILGGRVQAV